MTTMMIGEVARQAGIPSSTLRYYESIDLLPPPPRDKGRRQYDETIFQHLALIKIARQAGFTLAEIKAMLSTSEPANFSAGWKQNARKKLAELDALIERTQAMKAVLKKGLACDCRDVNGCDLIRQDLHNS